MSGMAWTFIELFIFAIDISGMFWYLNKMLYQNRTPFPKAVIGGVVLFSHLAACYLFSIPDMIRIPVGAGIVISYAWLTYRKPIGLTVFHSIAGILMLGVSDASIVFLFTLIPGVDFSMVAGHTFYRLHVMVISKLIYLFMLFIFSHYRSTAVKNVSYWLMVILPPAISMAILASLIEYGNEMDSTGKWELAAASAGILIMNVVLMVLHGRLSRNTRLLVEKEKMLQQAELQNIYFNEALTASENLRGFRHDLRNHLQVLSGLLEMNNVQKAREYLAEIGQFINGSDVTINCGHPMIDAVLGSKVALAKKLGIDIIHTVSISQEIEMEPMDLCSILGNVMDNAIEACTRIAVAGKPKRIEICIHDTCGDLQIFVNNTASPARPGKRALPFRKAGSEHGIGLPNVRRTVSKYSGVFQIDKAEEQFRVRIIIPLEKRLA